MDNNIIKKLYKKDGYTLRMIAEKYNTNHHLIKRRLIEMGVKITRRNTLKKFSDAHRKKISDSRKKLKANGWKPYNLGLKVSKEQLYKNMASHIRFNVPFQWLKQFEDVEKLKLLNRAITPRDTRFKVDTEWYRDYILKFYYDKQFNDIYCKWLFGGKKDKYLMPTLDHINPKANGGNNDLSNLQFLTWFENRAKNDMPLVVWQEMKENIKNYLL
jgi:5-methylcytosine-specific restriction endonuclease McrA